MAAGFVGCEEYTAQAFGVELGARGTVSMALREPQGPQSSYATSKSKIFTAGDMHRGQSRGVWAIAEGRECAREIDEFLIGEAQ